MEKEVKRIGKKYSKEWMELVHKREEFEKASLCYNKLDKEKRRQDLRKILKESDPLEQLPVIKMMGDGYFLRGLRVREA